MTAVDEYQREWIRWLHRAPDASARLVCFPHAGGSATYYRDIFPALAPDVSVLAVQYPGRQDRQDDPCVEDVETLTARIVQALRPLAGPRLLFFGHSMGAIIAYEVALELERITGSALDWLFVSARPAPSRHRPSRLHLLGDRAILARVRQISGSQARLLDNDELLAMALPALRADCKAIDTYRYRPGRRLRAPIYALVGDADPVASLDDVAAWRHHTSDRFELRVIPGGHFYLDERPAEVAAAVAGVVNPGTPGERGCPHP
jgi:pyochelin biosynthetic protein PchC